MGGKAMGTGRIRLIQAFALLGALLVAGELVWLHILESDGLAAKAQQQHQNDTQIVPQRGSILDTNRTLLATAEYLADVEAAPNQIRGSGRSAQAVASELGQLLGVPPEQLVSRLNQPNKTYALLAKGVTPH
ncbi:MAG: hypothetical protein OXM03_12695, partial [Chloroflexota bacterium]|nr:hypothetical protein [Chloroflexota bacterium]